MHTAHRVRCAGTTRVRTLHTVHWVQSAKDQRVWAGDCSLQYWSGPEVEMSLLRRPVARVPGEETESVSVDRGDEAASCGVKVMR